MSDREVCFLSRVFFFTSISYPLLCHFETLLKSAARTLHDMQFQMEDSVHHILIAFALSYRALWKNREKKFFIIPHELIKANINPCLIVGTHSCSGIACICSWHSWWQDCVCLPYFANTSHWCLWFSVICFCAVALSLAVKQPYDMVAVFLLQTHCSLLPPQSSGLSQHDWAALRRMQPPPLANPAQWSISAGLVLSFVVSSKVVFPSKRIFCWCVTLEVLHK